MTQIIREGLRVSCTKAIRGLLRKSGWRYTDTFYEWNTVLFDVTLNIAVVLLYLMSVCHSVAMNMFLMAIHLPSSVVLAVWNFVGRKFCHCSVGLYARMAAQHQPQTAYPVVFSVPLSVSPTENFMLSLNFITQWKTYWEWVGNTTVFDFSLLHRFVCTYCL